MHKFSLVSKLISPFLAVALLLQPLFGVIGLRLVVGATAEAQSAAPANSTAGDGHIFLPQVSVLPGPPVFTINSPADGSTISGVLYFSIQPLVAGATTSVAFQAGFTDLGSDDNGANGFRTILDTKGIPTGEIELSATAHGPGGETTQSIHVHVAPNPPASTTVGAQGAVLSSEIGSIITIPPGALPEGANVSVTERSQQEIQTEHGIDWEKLGVTFLGAQEVQTGEPLARPTHRRLGRLWQQGSGRTVGR